MKTFNETLEQIEEKLIAKFEDTYFGLTLITEDYAIFNYQNFWDSRPECTKFIEEEREFLINESLKLKGKFQKHIFIADDAVKLY